MLNRATYDRIDNIIDRKDKQNFEKAAQSMITDLLINGFDRKEVELYLKALISNHMR